MKRIFCGLGALLLFASAACAQRGISPPDPFILNDALAKSQGAFPYQQTSGLARRTQAFNSGLKNLVLIVAGQSNCASVTPTLYTPSSSSVVDQLSIYDGGSYEINGPLLGTQYNSVLGPGNVSARLAQEAITGGFDRVILVNVCIAGSIAADWATGSLSDRIPVALRRLASRGYIPGATGLTFAISWWQGESDTATSQASYTASMNTVLANAQAAGFTGSSCRFFVNEETWIAGAVNATIQAAQLAMPNGTTFFSGGNMDGLNALNRQADNTHWNDIGALNAASAAWAAMHASGAPY